MRPTVTNPIKIKETKNMKNYNGSDLSRAFRQLYAREKSLSPDNC